jgi:hypothetical protein
MDDRLADRDRPFPSFISASRSDRLTPSAQVNQQPATNNQLATCKYKQKETMIIHI